MNACVDCLTPLPDGMRRCGRCLAVAVRGQREDAAAVDARLHAVEARRRYDERLGQRSLEQDDAWAQPADPRPASLNLR